jgi:ribose transport system substrate-binding protein
MGSKWISRWAAAAAAVVAALAIAACGSSSNNSSSSSGSTSAQSGSSDSAKATATANIASLLKPEEKIPDSTPLPKAPPTGKSVDIMDCGVPACTAWAEAAAKAATTLGWHPRRILEGVTPQKITEAWNIVAGQLPDAVVNNGLPSALFSKQLAVLASHKIPVLNSSVTEGAGKGQTFVEENGVKDGKTIGKVMTDWALSEVGSKANILYVTSPEFPILAAYEEGLNEELKALCPSCEKTKVEVSTAAIGSGQNTAQVVAALRSHPNINYIIGLDDLTTGLPSALKAAGINVPIVGHAPGPPQFQYLREGGNYKASSVSPLFEDGWQMMDWLARFFEGVPTAPAEKEYAQFVLTAKTLPADSTKYFGFVPNFETQYKELWKLQ